MVMEGQSEKVKAKGEEFLKHLSELYQDNPGYSAYFSKTAQDYRYQNDAAAQLECKKLPSHCQYCGATLIPGSYKTRIKPKMLKTHTLMKEHVRYQEMQAARKSGATLRGPGMSKFRQKRIQDFYKSHSTVRITCNLCKKVTSIKGAGQWKQRKTPQDTNSKEGGQTKAQLKRKKKKQRYLANKNKTQDHGLNITSSTNQSILSLSSTNQTDLSISLTNEMDSPSPNQDVDSSSVANESDVFESANNSAVIDDFRGLTPISSSTPMIKRKKQMDLDSSRPLSPANITKKGPFRQNSISSQSSASSLNSSKKSQDLSSNSSSLNMLLQGMNNQSPSPGGKKSKRQKKKLQHSKLAGILRNDSDKSKNANSLGEFLSSL
ncbi:unnamed protein product [Owenia fusiformis]|uniref:Uncharacterized protein n=1 Tax=Owenia fusiformis TaxID=6347 RepID=A0A8J1UQ13_OWEFU|nr:unnamed protein product [Owenia fusiformis]